MPYESNAERNRSRHALAIALAIIVLVFHFVGSFAASFIAYSEYEKPDGAAWSRIAKVLMSPIIWAPNALLDTVDNQFFLLALNSSIWGFTTFAIINWYPRKKRGKPGFDVIEAKNT